MAGIRDLGRLSAIRRGHAELQAGVEVGCPVLVHSSGGTRWPKELGDDVHNFDIAIEGARHDVVLSLPEHRAAAYAEIDRWMSTYVD